MCPGHWHRPGPPSPGDISHYARTPSRTRCPENGSISIQFHTPCIQYMFPELPFQFVKRIRSFISLNSKAIYFVFYRSLKFSLQSKPQQINIEHIVFDDKTQFLLIARRPLYKTFEQIIDPGLWRVFGLISCNPAKDRERLTVTACDSGDGVIVNNASCPNGPTITSSETFNFDTSRNRKNKEALVYIFVESWSGKSCVKSKNSGWRREGGWVVRRISLLTNCFN